MDPTNMMYAVPDISEPVSQCDVIDDCPIFGFDTKSTNLDPDAQPVRWRERVVVLTQACDLAQSKSNKTLVALVQPAKLLVERGILKDTTIRDQVRRGQVFGWYYLPAAPTPIAFPESIIDLRDLHTVPRAILGQLIGNGKRVCRFLSPYREHLAQHFAVTYMRIGLPAPYETES